MGIICLMPRLGLRLKSKKERKLYPKEVYNEVLHILSQVVDAPHDVYGGSADGAILGVDENWARLAFAFYADGHRALHDYRLVTNYSHW